MSLEALSKVNPLTLAILLLAMGGGSGAGIFALFKPPANGIERRLDRIEILLDRRLQEQQDRISGHQGRLERHDWRLDSHRDRLNGHAAKNMEQDEKLSGIRDSITRLDATNGKL